MRSIHLVLITLLSIPLGACGQSVNVSSDESITKEEDLLSADSNTPRIAVPERIQWSSDSCIETRQLKEVLGIGEIELENSLGEPESKETFRLASRQSEFHVQLQNTYPLSVAGNTDVELREWTWSQDSCRLTVWLHQKEHGWESFESLLWHEEAEF